jgi:hypothetical protein
MPDSLESHTTARHRPAAEFSVGRIVYAPLMLSLPFSLPLTAAVIVTIAMGWLPASADSGTHWAEALAVMPQIFVICVCACWLAFGLAMARSRRRAVPVTDRRSDL